MINYRATQIARQSISAPLKELLTDLRFDDLWLTDSILHFGEGKAYADTEALNRIAPTMAYDPHSEDHAKRSPAVLSVPVQTVFSCYVYNVMLPDTRAAAHRRLLEISDTVIWVVRADRIEGTPFEDGVLTKANTFQKSYTIEEAHREWPNATVLSHRKGRWITMLE